jgi:N-acetylglucosamine-6-sulfatase
VVRRRSRRALFVALALAGFAATPAALDAPAANAQTGEPQPNVVVVMTDDQDRRSLSVMRAVRDKLTEQGTKFTSFFATFPLCCPSRATFLSGQYAHNHGVDFEREITPAGFSEFDDRGTLPVSLKRAGYRTGYIGKYLNGYGTGDPLYIPPGWSHWQAAVKSSATQMYGYTLNENGELRQFGEQRRDYQTDVYARKAEGFIRDSAGRPSPFFLTVAPSAPHVEDDRNADPNPRPAPRHLGSFSDRPLPRPESFDEADVSDKPSFVQDAPRIDAEGEQRLTERYRARLGSLRAVDEMVARIVDTLRDTGELASTYVIFTSDNGYMLGEHRLTKKVWLYEESAGVPMILRGPGVPAGKVRTQVTGNIDLAPTILDVTGAERLREMDGRSIMAFAQSRRRGTGRDILLENGASAAVRTPTHMYAEHYGTGAGTERELYDLAADPLQLESFHDQDPVLQSQLEARLRELENCQDEQCR